MVREFEFFVQRGEVKKQAIDKNLAAANRKESVERLELAKVLLKMKKYKYALENAYEAAREYADAFLYEKGYKSYSHEASIAFLLKEGFSGRIILELDRFRKIRNDIKYYGKDCEESDAIAAIQLAESLIQK